MKNIFLTSGIILMLAVPAYATTDIAAGSSTGSCVEDVLGVDDGSTQFEAKWVAVVSGAINLNSNRYASSSQADNSPSSTASTAAAPTPLYSKYENGMYSSSANASAGTNAITSITTEPVMTGYTFDGFYTGKAGTGTKVINSDRSFTAVADEQVTTSNGTATWYANWIANLGTVTLDSSYSRTNNCSAGQNSVSYANPTTNPNPATLYTKYGEGVYGASARTSAITSLTQTPALTGYTFGGYYLSSDTNFTGTAYITSANAFDNGLKNLVTTDGGSATLKAKWTPKTHTITYDCGAAGAAAGQAATQSVTHDDCYTLNDVATQCNSAYATGHTFNGWSCTNNVSSLGGRYTVDNDTTCTAQWTTHTIGLDYNANCAAGTSCEDWTNDGDETCDYGSTFNLPTAPQKTGYTFDGWTVTSVTPGINGGVQQ